MFHYFVKENPLGRNIAVVPLVQCIARPGKVLFEPSLEVVEVGMYRRLCEFGAGIWVRRHRNGGEDSGSGSDTHLEIQFWEAGIASRFKLEQSVSFIWMAGTASQPYMFQHAPAPSYFRSSSAAITPYFVGLQALCSQIVARVYAHPRHSLCLLLGAVGAINAPHSPCKARPTLEDYNFTSQ